MKVKISLKWALSAVSALFLAGCGGSGGKTGGYGEELYSPRYSSGFSVYEAGDSSSVLVVRNPWQGAENVTSELFLSNGGEKAPEDFRGASVSVPLKKVVCLSSSHAAFIDALGLTGAIAGVSGARYISNEKILRGYEEGKVADVGYDSNLNYELLASLKPDLVFIYGVGGENTAVTEKLKELGINVVYIGEYLEETALGKAEWIIPFGELFGLRGEAEEIFGGIAERYERMREMVAGAAEKPKVMLNSPYRDVWFVPGGKSYMAALISDAGGEYIYKGNDSAASMPVSGEAAYLAVSGADIWLNPNQARSIGELAAQNPKFSDIPVVKNGRVYNATKRSTAGGGSDFWESGVVRADRVLEDMIMIMHPGLIAGGELYYFERLE